MELEREGGEGREMEGEVDGVRKGRREGGKEGRGGRWRER
jgi:hypothetical protein